MNDMSSLTIRLPEKVLNEVDRRAQNLHLSRTAYIRKAIDKINSEMQEKEKKENLINASKRVKKIA